jgi:hypothetical protein
MAKKDDTVPDLGPAPAPKVKKKPAKMQPHLRAMHKLDVLFWELDTRTKYLVAKYAWESYGVPLSALAGNQNGSDHLGSMLSALPATVVTVPNHHG